MKKENASNIFNAATEYYFSCMENSPNRKKHIKSLNINFLTADETKIGLAENSLNQLYEHLLNLGYSKEKILESKLCFEDENGNILDRFQNRIILPAFDIDNQCFGLCGRYIKDDDQPKFINISNPINNNFAGFNINPNNEFIIICESIVDAIKIYNCGISNAVSKLPQTLGIANSDVEFLKNFNKVLLFFDQDAYGQKLAKAYEEVLKANNISVINLINIVNIDIAEYCTKCNYGDLFFVDNILLKCNKDLKEVTIPKQITYISDMAFEGCYNLESITVLNPKARILDYTLFDCHNLKELHFPKGIAYMGENAIGSDIKATIFAPEPKIFSPKEYAKNHGIKFVEE